MFSATGSFTASMMWLMSVVKFTLTNDYLLLVKCIIISMRQRHRKVEVGQTVDTEAIWVKLNTVVLFRLFKTELAS